MSILRVCFKTRKWVKMDKLRKLEMSFLSMSTNIEEWKNEGVYVCMYKVLFICLNLKILNHLSH